MPATTPRRYGAHHSHYQPRDERGQFVPYRIIGRLLGRTMVAHSSRVVTVAGSWVQLPYHRPLGT